MSPRHSGDTVVIIGAGIVGAACAYASARAGLQVTVLDRAAAVSGTSAGGEGNLLVSDKPPGPELRLAQYAADLWPGLVEQAAALGPDFPDLEYERKGGLVVATDPAAGAALTAFAAAQRSAGVSAIDLTGAEARTLEPDLSETACAAVHYPEDAQVQPVAAAEALLALARRHGAAMRPMTPVTGALISGGRIVGARTPYGPVHADHVVLAAGPWSGEVSALLGAPLPVRPRRGMVLVTARMPRRIRHKVYDADYVGAVESDAAALQTSAVVESTAAGTVLIGSSRQQIGFDDRVRTEVLRRIAARAVALFPFLAEVMTIRAYGGFRPYVPDHLPVIGPDPRLPGLHHATGHEGAGVGLSLATAELVLAGLTGSEPAVPLGDFAVDRPGLAPHLATVA